MFLRTRRGRGSQEFGTPGRSLAPGHPDLDVYRSRFELLFHLLGPWVVESLYLGYNDVEGGFEELERIMVRGR
jgi:hypothetical protein